MAETGEAATVSQRHRATRADRPWLGVLGLCTLVLLAFGASAHYGFVNWDDPQNYVENPNLPLFGLAQLKWVCTTLHMGVYEPLAWVLIGLEWRLSAGSPQAMHAVSLALQCLDAVVLWWLITAFLARILPQADPVTRRRSAWLAAGLFAIHPLRTEPVVWLSSQPYLPSILFFMLAVVAHLRANEPDRPASQRRRALIGTWVLYLVAVLFKAVAVSLPLFLLVVDVYPLRRLGGERGWFGPQVRRVWWEKLPMVLVAAPIMALAFVAKLDVMVSVAHSGWTSRLGHAATTLWFHTGKTVFPWPLHAFYLAGDVSLANPRSLVPFLATLLSVGLLYRMRRQTPWLVAAAVGYFVVLAPNIGLVRVGEQLTTDRYSYLASVSWAICGAGALCHLMSIGRARLAGALALACAVPLLLLSRFQTTTWQDSEALWRHVLAHEQGPSPVPYNNLADVLMLKGKKAEALQYWKKAHALAPNLPQTNWGLAISLAEAGALDQSLSLLYRGLALDPYHAHPYWVLGTVLSLGGRNREAREAFQRALQLEPDHVNALTNLGILEIQQGDKAKGKALLLRAIAVDPKHQLAHYNLGNLLLEEGDLQGALREAELAVRLDPRHQPAREGLDRARAALAKKGGAPSN
jgi:Flp pilus assembly protein TadD